MKTALEWWKYFEDNRDNNPSYFELIEEYALAMDTLKKYVMDNPEENFGVEVPDVEYTPDEIKLIVAIRLEIAKELLQ